MHVEISNIFLTWTIYIIFSRFVLDTTSFRCHSTKNYREQGNNYSDYKKTTVYNSAIMISPTGFLQAISPLAQGSMSDRELYKQGFNENPDFKKVIKNGDTLLVDRGFNIKDLTLKKGVKLVMPPFLRGRKKFTYKELLASRIITRARWAWFWSFQHLFIFV